MAKPLFLHSSGTSTTRLHFQDAFDLPQILGHRSSDLFSKDSFIELNCQENQTVIRSGIQE